MGCSHLPKASSKTGGWERSYSCGTLRDRPLLPQWIRFLELISLLLLLLLSLLLLLLLLVCGMLLYMLCITSQMCSHLVVACLWLIDVAPANMSVDGEREN